MGQAKSHFFLIISICFLIWSCQKSNDGGSGNAATVDIPIYQSVTKENYLSGEMFCKKYVNTSDPATKEFGKWIEVPKNYNGKDSKKIKIYYYSKLPFNPALPSSIFVDGGPGQNTHGFESILDGQVNEIKFDQRGIGCSAPPTWEDYTDESMYSSENNANDIEMIRKSLGIKSWSVFGVSYGTVPATIYGQLFPESTKSIILEGVVGKISNLSRFTFQVEKYNLIFQSLNPEQKKAFSSIVTGNEIDKQDLLVTLLTSAAYRDNGYKHVQKLLTNVLFKQDGTWNQEIALKIQENLDSTNKQFDTPQYPGVTDFNILSVFNCKELDGWHRGQYTLAFSEEKGFYEREINNPTSVFKSFCEGWKISEKSQKNFDESEYKIKKNVYYFQGSHDGATRIDGALNHWKTVPTGNAYFMLSKKGGHNPGLTKLRSDDEWVKKGQKALYYKAMVAEEISEKLIQLNNESIRKLKDSSFENRNEWILYVNNKIELKEFQNEFEGLSIFKNKNMIKRSRRF